MISKKGCFYCIFVIQYIVFLVKINTIKIRPYVQSGRIFEESESVTMWVSDDDNLMPLKIKAGLLVGSLNADLYEYKNLKATSKFTK